MIDLREKVVYLAAPKRLFDSDLYQEAKRYLSQRCKSLYDPRGKYKSNQEWLENYETDLLECDVMVIVSDDDFIGKGVYSEYVFMLSRYCKCYYYDDVGDDTMRLVPIKRIEISDENDWRDYAFIVY